MQGTQEAYIGSFYMPHRQKAHLHNLDRSLQKITEKRDRHIVLCGDFNCPDINWDTHTVPPGASDRQVQQQLIDLAEKFNLHQMQDRPTRENNILDLVFTTNPTLFKSSANAPGLSDHDILITDFCVRPFRTRQAPRKCYLFGKANWEGLRQAALETSKKVAPPCSNDENVHDLWKTFKFHLIDSIDKHVPSIFFVCRGLVENYVASRSLRKDSIGRLGKQGPGPTTGTPRKSARDFSVKLSGTSSTTTSKKVLNRITANHFGDT
jgi:hypothetical protein